MVLLLTKEMKEVPVVPSEKYYLQLDTYQGRNVIGTIFANACSITIDKTIELGRESYDHAILPFRLLTTRCTYQSFVSAMHSRKGSPFSPWR